MRRWGFLFLLTWFECFLGGIFTFAGEFHLELKQNNLLKEQIHPIQDFLAQAEALVPPALKEKLNYTIKVHFVPISPGTRVRVPFCSYDFKETSLQVSADASSSEPPSLADTYGQVDAEGRILINQLLIPEIIEKLTDDFRDEVNSSSKEAILSLEAASKAINVF